MKKDNGYITPVNTFLCLNQIDMSSMILLIDNATEDI